MKKLLIILTIFFIFSCAFMPEPVNVEAKPDIIKVETNWETDDYNIWWENDGTWEIMNETWNQGDKK